MRRPCRKLLSQVGADDVLVPLGAVAAFAIKLFEDVTAIGEEPRPLAYGATGWRLQPVTALVECCQTHTPHGHGASLQSPQIRAGQEVHTQGSVQLQRPGKDDDARW